MKKTCMKLEPIEYREHSFTQKKINSTNKYKFKLKKTYLVKPDHKRLTIFGWLSSNLIGALA